MMYNDLFYQIALLQIKGIGDITAKQLVAHFGNSENIFRLNKNELTKALGVGNGIANQIISAKKNAFEIAEKELNFIQKNSINTAFYGDPNYPSKLKDIADGPFVLYYKGKLEFNNYYNLAIVGTRKNTSYGAYITEKIIDELSDYPVIITSGLAYGIDIIAHKSSLKNNIITHGVVAHGLNKIYPSLHTEYAKEMVEKNGCIVTEHISDTPPDKENFPKRNRIVAGLCDAVLLIESAQSGGAMITAELALSYNRELMAVPGRTNDNMSAGCNHLIKSNKAGLVTCTDDIVQFMNWHKKQTPVKNKQIPLFDFANDDEALIYQIIQANTQIHIDEISIKSKLQLSKLAGILLSLEFNNHIKSLPGKRYICR